MENVEMEKSTRPQIFVLSFKMSSLVPLWTVDNVEEV